MLLVLVPVPVPLLLQVEVGHLGPEARGWWGKTEAESC